MASEINKFIIISISMKMLHFHLAHALLIHNVVRTSANLIDIDQHEVMPE